MRYKVTGLLLFAILITGLAGAPLLAGNEALMDPSTLGTQAPDNYQVKFETSAGDFLIEVTRELAPRGADRFYNLVKHGFYDDVRFFRVVPNFVVQFGLNGDPEVSKVWSQANIDDDPVKGSNTKGTITFATAGPNTRTTQVFINLRDNSRLNGMGFSPFGKVTEGMEIVEKLYAGYGDGPPSGRGPNQGRITAQGNAYLKESFPDLDYIKAATIVPAAQE